MENAKNTVFTCFSSNVWYFLTVLEPNIHFYFIPNKKYRSFRWFWVPFQLLRTKSRLCGSSQSSRRNEILRFRQMHQNASDPSEIWFLGELCDEPQKRDFVVWSWEGTQNFRNDLYFLFVIKYNCLGASKTAKTYQIYHEKTHFFVYWSYVWWSSRYCCNLKGNLNIQHSRFFFQIFYFFRKV